MCVIKDKAGFIVQCKISDIPLVWETKTRTFNPNHVINFSKLTRSIENIVKAMFSK